MIALGGRIMRLFFAPSSAGHSPAALSPYATSTYDTPLSYLSP
jgi:hypothetical protein